MVEHQSRKQINAGLDEIQKSPTNHGERKAIVIRPATDQRKSLMECEVSPERGVHGDNWADGCWKSLSDDSPHPDVQVAIMNARAIGLIAQNEERWSLAGDNLYFDLDLSSDNFPSGSRLQIGSVVLEVTGEVHNGCRKSAQRCGSNAVKFVNSDIGKRLLLRGIYAKVVTGCLFHVSDEMAKISESLRLSEGGDLLHRILRTGNQSG